VYQFLKYHIWSPSSAFVTCPSAMTDGAARLSGKHVGDINLHKEQQKVLRDAYHNLTSRDPQRAWTSGQWMTERSGGSDVRSTETVATLVQGNDIGIDASGSPLVPYSITGFKWFSSVSDSNMTILLAQTPAGISAFFAPMRRCKETIESAGTTVLAVPDPSKSELNGISIQRLKPKLGTRAVPTAELVLDGTRPGCWVPRARASVRSPRC
jgi:alkylation response protein AidB-like acyl-CoA dehydrogenase